MKKLIPVFAIALLITSCTKELQQKQVVINPNPSSMEEMIVPAHFSYHTSEQIPFNITLLNNLDEPISGVRIDIMDDSPENGGKILATGTSNSAGQLIATYELPTYLKEVVINTDYIGIVNNVLVNINGTNTIEKRIGGKTPERVRTAEAKHVVQPHAYGKGFSRLSYRLGRFTTGSEGGVPNYLVTPRDTISSQFLADVNSALPEYKAVPTYHPEYIASTAERNVNLTALSDVWITFVHEGAGYKNGLFYFVYNKNHKPTNASQIDSLIAIFPNTSYSGSGGGLTSGDKVYIGRWGADTCIGFAIAANGWNGTTVNAGSVFYYTIKELNPESTISKQEHSVMIYHNASKRFLLSFEDLNRDAGSDDDFNDCVFYATSNPVTSISTERVVATTNSDNDDDHDGVLNAFDEYPNDANKAYNVHYPAAGVWASVAFEDLWPSQGDYDMNDVVVNYHYSAVTNAGNKIVSMNAGFKLRAAGGIFHNGFSVELPVNANTISSISGGQGLESGTTKAILKVFNDSKSLISTYNTRKGQAWTDVDTINMSMTFSTAQNFSLGTLNPFIYINESDKGRGYEVHLPDKTPTEKATLSVLGTNADNSIPSSGRYYKTATTLPFALSIPVSFDYPAEKNSIISAYSKFANWAQTNGANNADWYLNVSGNRVASKIY